MSHIEVEPRPNEEYIQVLNADFPDFVVRDMRFLGNGWHSAAMLVNEEWVFRFPRHLFDPDNIDDYKMSQLQREPVVLKALHGRTRYQTPLPELIPKSGLYFGYRLVPGRLWNEKNDTHKSESFLGQWLDVRQAISEALPVDAAHQLDVPDYNIDMLLDELVAIGQDTKTPKAVKDLLTTATKTVHDNMPPKASWTFIHTDLQVRNTLLDEDDTITGIIDFGGAEVGPREADFAFWSNWQDDSLERVAKLAAERGEPINVELTKAIRQIYDFYDYLLCQRYGADDSARFYWDKIQWWIEQSQTQKVN